jgi:hypothetical protein
MDVGRLFSAGFASRTAALSGVVKARPHGALALGQATWDFAVV